MKQLICLFGTCLAVWLLGLTSHATAQDISDQCFSSIPTASVFSSSEVVHNAGALPAAMLKYENGNWAGQPNGAAISIAPTVACEASKAIYMPYSDTDEVSAVAFRITEPLPGFGSRTFQFTSVSHGAGSSGTFAPRVYAASSPFVVGNDGTINAALLGQLPNAGGNWNTSNFTFACTGNTNGDSWLIVVADQSAGMIFNFCQSNISATNIDLGPDQTICPGTSVALSINCTPCAIAWSNGSQGNTANITSSGVYSVTANNGCNTVTDEIEITVSPEPNIVPANDTILCSGQTLILETEGWDQTQTWPDGSNGETFAIDSAGVYDVIISDNCFNNMVRTLTVQEDSIPVVEFPSDTVLCEGQVLLLDPTWIGPDSVVYQWSDGFEEVQRFVNDPGTEETIVYSVSATNNCGTGADQISVAYSYNPGDVLDGGYELCLGRDLVIDLSSVDADFLWSDGATTAINQIDELGDFWVQISDDDGCFALDPEFSFLNEVDCECPLYMPTAFTPDGDLLNDEFGVEFVCPPYDFRLDIINRWGNVIWSSNTPARKWNGKSGGEEVEGGVFSYRVQYALTFDGFPVVKFGTAVLLR